MSKVLFVPSAPPIVLGRSSWVRGRKLFVCPGSVPPQLSFCWRSRLICCSAASASAVAEIPSKEEKAPPKGTVLLERLSVGDKLSAEVLRVGPANSLWLDVSVVRRGRRGRYFHVDARLRFTLSLVKNEDGTVNCEHVEPREVVGSRLSVLVKKISVDAGRLEVERTRKPSSSSPNVSNRKRKRKPVVVEDGIPLESLDVGQQLNGHITRLGKYGALLDCGVVRPGRRGALVAVTGLMKRKHFPEKCASDADFVFRDDVERKLRVGDEVLVYVRAALISNGFLWLSGVPVTKSDLEQETKAWVTKIRRQNRRKFGPSSVTVGEEVIGTVRKQVKYGAFVDVGLTVNGLLHFSNMGKKHRDDWRITVVDEARVLVKVISNTNDRVGLELVSLMDEIIEEEVERTIALERRKYPDALTAGERYQEELNKAVRSKTFALDEGVAMSPIDQRLKDIQPDAGRERSRKTVAISKEVGLDDVDSVSGDDNDVDANDRSGTDDFDDTFTDEYFEDKYNF
jgi:predicted RNA-binding protein with RPS1 domain